MHTRESFFPGVLGKPIEFKISLSSKRWEMIKWIKKNRMPSLSNQGTGFAIMDWNEVSPQTLLTPYSSVEILEKSGFRKRSPSAATATATAASQNASHCLWPPPWEKRLSEAPKVGGKWGWGGETKLERQRAIKKRKNMQELHENDERRVNTVSWGCSGWINSTAAEVREAR